ncbi:MAG: response regulator, partial [Halobaculum sp.]
MTGEHRDTAHVLCVDDDEAVAEVTAELLAREAEGVVTSVVTDPERALDRIRDDRVDCVVSDYDMPRMDGLELLAEVRERDPGMPFVLFTGQGSEDIASEAISAGVTEYLQKGAGTDQYTVLANRVEQAVARRQTERELAVERERRTGLFRDNPDPVIEGAVVSDPGEELAVEIVDVNAAFEETFGVDRESLRGESPENVLAPEGTELDTDELIEQLAREGTVQTEVRRQTADGVGEFLLTLIQLSPPAGPETGYAVYTDITDRKRRERRIDELARESGALLRADTREAAAERAVELVQDRFDVSLTGVHLREGDRLPPTVVAGPVRETYDPVPTYRRDRDEAADRFVWEAFENGEARAITDVRDASLHEATRAGSGVIHPLGDHGVLIAADETYEVVDETTESLTEIVATNLTAALDRIERERITATLQDAAREIGASDSVRAACRRTTDAAREILEFEYCSVDLVAADQFVPVVLSEGIDPAEVQLFDTDEGVLGATYRQGERFVVGDSVAHEHAEPREQSFRSALSVPVGDHGVFQAVARDRDAFDERDADRAESLVAHLAATLDRLRDAPDAPL